jgi:hypothetical protein
MSAHHPSSWHGTLAPWFQIPCEAQGEVTYIFAKMISVQNEVFVLLFLGPYSKEAYVLVFLPYTFI